jgi:hypothetical protein
LAVKRATKLEVVDDELGCLIGQMAAASCTTLFSQVWKACPLKRMPTNIEGERAPIDVVKLARSSGRGLEAGEELGGGRQGVVPLATGPCRSRRPS